MIAAPTFVVTPAPQELLEGDTVRFFGKVHGKPLPKVTWFKDGEAIDGDNDMKIQHKENTRKLEVESWLKMAKGALEHDSPNYQIMAENSAGSIMADFSLTGMAHQQCQAYYICIDYSIGCCESVFCCKHMSHHTVYFTF